jgi:hypothetical protein
MKVRFRRVIGVLFLVLAIGMMLVRFVGSPIVTRMINKKLAALEDYTGRVDGVHLSLWRATITATDFTLSLRNQDSGEPLVRVKQASLAVAVLPLLKGTLGGHGTVDGVEVVLVKTQLDELKQDAAEKAPEAKAWTAVIQEAFPLEITRFEAENVRISFTDKTSTPAGRLVIDQLKLVATEVTNRPQAEELPTHVTVQGRVGGTGSLTLDIRADPSAKQPRFETRMEIRNLALVPIHDFLLSYALIDVSDGSFEVFSEITALDGRYEGYVKPFFKDLQFKAVPDPNKNLMQRVATKVASAVTDALKNDQGDVATKAPFKGNFENNEVDVWTTIQNLLRNAFIQSLREGLEGQSPTGYASLAGLASGISR